jgi:predicted nucleic acid-binding protein
MTYLLDVSTIIALLWRTQADHDKVSVGAKGKKLAVCPITELGFIRVSTSKAFNLPMDDARKLLEDFIGFAEFVPDDLRALDGAVAPSSTKTTDWYLANLAHKHGMQWATLDQTAKHPAAVLIN